MKCNECKGVLKNSFLPGSGSRHANVMFVGMNPSYRRHKTTTAAFKGLEGDKFRQILKEAKLPVNELFITNLIKCSFPNNEVNFEFANNCYEKVFKNELKEINPLLVVCLGNFVYDFLKDKLPNVVKVWHPNFVTSYHKELKTTYIQQLNNIYHNFLQKIKYKKIYFDGPDKVGKTTLRKNFVKQYTQLFATFDRSIISNLVYDKILNRQCLFSLDDLERDAIYVFVYNSNFEKHKQIMEKTKEVEFINYEKQLRYFKQVFMKLKEKHFCVVECDTAKTLNETTNELIRKVKEVIV